MEPAGGLVHRRLAADFQILRVARRFSAFATTSPRPGRTFDRRHGSAEEIERRKAAFEKLLRAHAYALSERETVRPDVYLAVRLQDAGTGVVELLGEGGAGGGLAALRRRGGNRRSARPALLEAGRARTGRAAHPRADPRLPRGRARPRFGDRLARPPRLRARARRPAQRLPTSDRRRWRSPAPMATRRSALSPPSGTCLRLHADYRVQVARRHLEIESEAASRARRCSSADSLPEERDFPGPEAELMFTPLDLEFPVDACLHCEYLPNRRRPAAGAQAHGRRRPDVARGESPGEHGASPDAEDRPADARELQRRLGGSDHPPLLRSALTYVVASAAGEEELEERIERLRSEVGPRIELHRPLGAQHQVFLATLPAQRFPLGAYREHLLPEEVGGDGPDRGQPRGLGDGPLHRLHADALAPADPPRSRRGLPEEPPAADPLHRLPGLGQVGRDAAADLPGLPAGLGADRATSTRRARPSTPTTAPPDPRDGGGDGADRALSRRALPGPDRPAADRPARRARPTRLSASSWRCCRRRCRRLGRPRSAPRWSWSAPARSETTC